MNKTKTFLIAASVALLALFGAAGCTQSPGNASGTSSSASSSSGEKLEFVAYPEQGDVSIFASGNVTRNGTQQINVGNDEAILEFSSKMENGSLTISVVDESGYSVGQIVLDNSSSKRKEMPVPKGDLTLDVQAQDASGSVYIQQVWILDGPGTPGS